MTPTDGERKAVAVCSRCGWPVDIQSPESCATCGPSIEISCRNVKCGARDRDFESYPKLRQVVEVRRV